jgi:DNA-binding NarL/FixJ family response regulator
MTSEAEIEVKKTVVVVDDDRGLREQIVQILGTAPDLECLGAYASGEQALPDILSKNPDVVLMDIQLPKMSGIQCVSEIKKVMPNKQVILGQIHRRLEIPERFLEIISWAILRRTANPSEDSDFAIATDKR